MTTYTIIAMYRINGIRTTKVPVEPQSGLTAKDLYKIQQSEVKKLWDEHPEMSQKDKVNNLDVNLEYRTDKPTKK